MKKADKQFVRPCASGFTLIEMSIVLVIIGLIVGGILVGQDLISVASQQAQISQISRYQTAVRTFQSKYGNYLPGDIPDPYAGNFGFQTRGTLAGQGDGNGIIEAEGSCGSSGSTNGYSNGCGELAMFWVDLSTAGMIDANIAALGAGYPSPTTHGNATLTSSPSVSQWIPAAKIGSNNFVYLFSRNSINYFAVSSVTFYSWMVHSTANPGMTVQQAYNIDSKIDDGLPQTGSVNTCYTNYEAGGFHYGFVWAAGSLNVGWPGTQGCSVSTTASAYSPDNCFDNNGAGGVQRYSLAQNANVQNCALSFKFQ